MNMIPLFQRETPLARFLALTVASGLSTEAEATGNPATFTTDKSKPLVSLIAPFAPVQAGSGDPSPENVRAISGFTGVTAYRTGKNLLDASDLANLTYTGSANTKNVRPLNKIPVKPGANIVWQGLKTDEKNIRFYDASGSYQSGYTITQYNKGTITFTVPEDSYFILPKWYRSASDLPVSEVVESNPQIEYGQEATAYEPFVSIDSFSVSFPSGQTIYGGSLDLVSGVLTVTHKFIDLTNQTGWVKSTSYPGGFYLNVQTFGTKPQTPFICSHAKSVTSVSDYVYGTCFCDSSVNIRIMESGSELTDWATYRTEQSQNGTPVCICAELATPQTIQLDPVTIQTLIGNNTVWTDTNGTNTVVYLKKA